MSVDNKVVSLDEKRGEIEVAKMNSDAELERRLNIEWEVNMLMTSIYETLTKIENPKQAIAAGMAMITTGKDLLVLELGKDGAKAYLDALDLDTAEIVERQIAEQKEAYEPPPENDGGDKGITWTDEQLRQLKSATSSIETDSEGGEI